MKQIRIVLIWLQFNYKYFLHFVIFLNTKIAVQQLFTKKLV